MILDNTLQGSSPGRHTIRLKTMNKMSGRLKVIPALQLFLILSMLFAPLTVYSLPRRGNPQARWENAEAQSPTALPSIQTHAGPMMFASFTPEDILHPRVLEELSGRTRNDSLSAHWSAMIRSELYRDYIRSEILRQRVPTELMAVAYIESSFDVMAESRTGARGLWQFADNSLAPWLSRSESFPRFDERFDFSKSTYAAMEKLKLNRRETGDWITGVAAYNGGLGRVSRSLAALEQRGDSAHDLGNSGETVDGGSTHESPFWKLKVQQEGQAYVRGAGNISKETSDYVPRYIAASVISSYPGRFGIRLNWSAPLHWEHLNPGVEVDLTRLARESGVPLQILRAGNGEYLDGIIPGGAHDLKFPRRYMESIRSAVETMRKDAAPGDPGYYTVQPGDTLWSISRAQGIELDILRNLNNLNQDTIIHAGMRLRLGEDSADTIN